MLWIKCFCESLYTKKTKFYTSLLEEGKESAAPQPRDESNKDIVKPHAEPIFQAEQPKEEKTRMPIKVASMLLMRDNTRLPDKPAMLVDTCVIVAPNSKEKGDEDKV